MQAGRTVCNKYVFSMLKIKISMFFADCPSLFIDTWID